MISSTLRTLILGTALVSLARLSNAQSNPQPPTTGVVQYQDLYGLGVRLGFYFQGVAYLIAFLDLFKYDFASQLTGTVLVFNNLVSWSLRTYAKDYTLAEAWISLALALSIAIPGSWMLASVFVVQRARLAKEKGKSIAKREIVRGRGLPISLAIVSTTGAIVAYMYFWIHEALPSKSTQVIWAFGSHAIGSNSLRMWMWIHVGILAIHLPLLMWMFSIWAYSILSWNNPDLDANNNVDAPIGFTARLIADQNERRKWNNIAWYSPRNASVSFIEAIILGTYWVFLIISVEKTIQDAKLQPLTSLLEQPLQLIPLFSGSIALANSIAALTRRDSAFSSSRPTAYAPIQSPPPDYIFQGHENFPLMPMPGLRRR